MLLGYSPGDEGRARHGVVAAERAKLRHGPAATRRVGRDRPVDQQVEARARSTCGRRVRRDGGHRAVPSTGGTWRHPYGFRQAAVLIHRGHAPDYPDGLGLALRPVLDPLSVPELPPLEPPLAVEPPERSPPDRPESPRSET